MKTLAVPLECATRNIIRARRSGDTRGNGHVDGRVDLFIDKKDVDSGLVRANGGPRDGIRAGIRPLSIHSRLSDHDGYRLGK